MILHPVGEVSVGRHGTGIVSSCALPSQGQPTWALLSDPHISGSPAQRARGRETEERLRRIVGELVSDPPSLVVVNGDIASGRGELGDYRRFLSIMQPMAKTCPIVLGVGNHDRRDNLQQAMTGTCEEEAGWLGSVVCQHPFRLVQLDSHISVDETGGEIGSEQLRWLLDTIESDPELHTVVCVHHPGVSASKGCQDFDDLLAIAHERTCIEGIFTGHDHAYSAETCDEVPHVALPSAGFSFSEDEDCGWVALDLDPEGLSLRVRGELKDSIHQTEPVAWSVRLPHGGWCDSGVAIRTG